LVFIVQLLNKQTQSDKIQHIYLVVNAVTFAKTHY